MNLRHMEVFRAVMLAGNVNGAAELLHVSQPAVSKMLARAADECGFRLFDRVKGRLVPTVEARHLYEEVETLWRGIEHLRDVSRKLAAPQTGILRLAVSANFAPHLVPRAVTALYGRFPQLQIRIEILIAPIMVDALLDRSMDLGVGVLPNEHPNLATVKRYQCGLACVMREDHPLAAKQQIRPSDLRGHRVITSPSETPLGQSLRRAYGRSAQWLRLDLEVRSSTSACWFAQAGAGVAVVDRATVAGRSFAGLSVRPFRSREKLHARIVRNRYQPVSIVQHAFYAAFDQAWEDAMEEGNTG